MGRFHWREHITEPFMVYTLVSAIAITGGYVLRILVHVMRGYLE